jgi:STE24 endopeptidase
MSTLSPPGADAATVAAAWVDSLGPEALEQAARYTAGNHWLLLWNLVVAGLVVWLVIRLGLLERVSRRIAPGRHNLRVFVVAATYFLVAALLALPWEIGTGWWRELQYGRTRQPLGDWLGQQALGTMIGALLGGLFMIGLYALIRRAGRWWWAWGGGFVALAISAMLIISPLFIEPLFNDYQPLERGEVRDVLEAHAIASGVPVDRIFVYDGSRQSNNFTANVSGVFGSARIAISDVALKGADLDEVEAVTGHEIGHYVLGHVWRLVALFSALSVVFFYFADRLYPWFARRFGSRASLEDPCGLPVMLFIVSVFLLLAQPVMNGVTRLGEIEADRYSLQTVGKPEALASALLKTAEYRNPRPNRLQEILFYTHPSVERRIAAALAWEGREGGRQQ